MRKEKEKKKSMIYLHSSKEMPRCPLSVCLAVFVWANHTSGREVPLLRVELDAVAVDVVECFT